jgi:MYXO-CTERM domain-containing protein
VDFLYASQLDLLRFVPVPEPAGGAPAAFAALALLARRRRYTRSRSG